MNPISFRKFWQLCAHQLGDSRFTFDHSASTITDMNHSVITSETLIKDLIMVCYRRSQCQHLDSPIDLNATFDVLGETAYKLQGQRQDDLLNIELLEEIGWCANQFYENSTQNTSSHEEPRLKTVVTPSKTVSKDTISQARVVSLSKAKLRRANASQ